MTLAVMRILRKMTALRCEDSSSSAVLTKKSRLFGFAQDDDHRSQELRIREAGSFGLATFGALFLLLR